jgi:hypothetical protein
LDTIAVDTGIPEARLVAVDMQQDVGFVDDSDDFFAIHHGSCDTSYNFMR